MVLFEPYVLFYRATSQEVISLQGSFNTSIFKHNLVVFGFRIIFMFHDEYSLKKIDENIQGFRAVYQKQ